MAEIDRKGPKGKPIIDPERDSYIQTIATSLLGLLDDLKRKNCPACGHANLEPRLGRNSVAILCKTPLERDPEFEGEFTECPYNKLVHLTDIVSGPFALKFQEPIEKPPVKPKPAPRRRRTTQR